MGTSLPALIRTNIREQSCTTPSTWFLSTKTSQHTQQSTTRVRRQCRHNTLHTISQWPKACREPLSHHWHRHSLYNLSSVQRRTTTTSRQCSCILSIPSVDRRLLLFPSLAVQPTVRHRPTYRHQTGTSRSCVRTATTAWRQRCLVESCKS